MSSAALKNLGLTPAEAAAFPREVRCLEAGLGLGRPLRGRELEHALVIYRRAYAALGVIERQLRPTDQPLLADWLGVVRANETRPLPQAEALRLALLRYASLGLEAEEAGELLDIFLATSYGAYRQYYFNRLSLSTLRCWMAYQRDFSPHLSEAQNLLALDLLPDAEHAVSEDMLARFVGEYAPKLVEKLTDGGLNYDNDPANWKVWFHLYQAHHLGLEGLPEDYLATPFAEVIRNVPNRLWYLTRMNGKPLDFVFAPGNPGFYHLASGQSARKYLPEIGMTRGAWRKLLTLPLIVDLAEMRSPDLYLWALSLVDNDELARQVPAFMPARFREAWEPILQQLGRLEHIAWNTEEGERLLGYVYHIVRDQPDFRVDVHRPEALLEAAAAHYARIEQSLAAVRQRRDAAAEADREARAQNQAQQEQRNLARQREYEAWLRKTKWAPLPKVNNFLHPSSKLRIQELTNGWELYLEGKAMGHCVADYARHCHDGRFSIWSLREERDQKIRSLVTIRIDVAWRQIVEARARFNRDPLSEYKTLVNSWAESNKIKPYAYWD